MEFVNDVCLYIDAKLVLLNCFFLGILAEPQCPLRAAWYLQYQVMI